MHLPRIVAAAAALCVAASTTGRAEDLASVLHDLQEWPGTKADHALERLRYLGPEQCGPALRSMLKSELPRFRVAASAALAAVRDPSAASLLTDRLVNDEDWEVRRNAAQALGDLRQRSAGGVLAKALSKDQNPRVRKAAAMALGRLGGSATALAQAAKTDRDMDVRLAALDALAPSMDKAGARAVAPLMGDSSTLIRFATARVLGWAGDAGGRGFLVKQLESQDPEGAGRAVKVLGDIPKGWAVDALTKALGHTDVSIADAAALALARRGDKRGVGHLKAVADGTGARALEAQAALAALGSDPR